MIWLDDLLRGHDLARAGHVRAASGSAAVLGVSVRCSDEPANPEIISFVRACGRGEAASVRGAVLFPSLGLSAAGSDGPPLLYKRKEQI